MAAGELGHHGIRVNAIAPGCTDTPMFAATDQLPGYRARLGERARAFWSLTLYNERHYFVDNPIARYAIGDRDALAHNDDGSLDIWVQHSSPGLEREANWLPAPAGLFNLMLRIYWPRQEVLDGDWSTLFDAPSNRLRSVFLGDPDSPDSGILELVTFAGDGTGDGDEAPKLPPRSGFFLLSFFVDVDETLARLAAVGLDGPERRIRAPGRGESSRWQRCATPMECSSSSSGSAPSDSRDRRAAVDRDRLTGDVGGRIGEQERGRRTDLHRLRHPLQRYRTLDPPPRLGCAPRAHRHRSIDAAGADAVDPHALRPVLHRGDPRERRHPALARRVARAVAVALEGGGRRDRHDRAPAFDEVRQGVLDGEERAHEVHAQHEQEVVELDLAERAKVVAVEDTGAGEHTVEPAEGVDCGRDRRLDFVLVSDIRGRCQRGCAAVGDLATSRARRRRGRPR